MSKKVQWLKGVALQDSESEKFFQFTQEIKEFKLSKTLMKILYNRGINTYDKVKSHLYMELYETHNPQLFKDSDKFIEGMKKAIQENHKIVIMGDYDADGVCATSIAVLALRNLDLDVDFYINNRFVEGYGMTELSLENILKKYPDTKTIITVDNGIVAFDAIKKATDMGIQVLVTDHHETHSTGKLPESYAVVNHKRKDCEYPFKELCGAGVIFKMMMLLYWELELDPDDVYDFLDILAVATVGDVVSITDENRVFVKEGLNLIRENHRLFFRVLSEKMDTKKIDEETIAFQYVPAINAIGRLDGCPSIVVEAIVSNDIQFVNDVCERMVATNIRRKELTTEHIEKAEAILLNQEESDVIVVYDESFEEGIVGLIAGRLCERYYKPTIALTKHGDKIKGSARSIPGYDVKKAFDYCADVLLGYGGHPQAGGVSLSEENLDAFKNKLNEYALEVLTDDMRKKSIYFDDVLTYSDINAELIDDINKISPYGQCFSKPIFGFKLDVINGGFERDMKKNVLKLKGPGGVSLIGFDNKQQYIDLGEPNRVAVLGCPSVNIWKANVSYQFMLLEDNMRADRSIPRR